MAQDRTHQGRVDFGDGILLENQTEPATEAHGGQAFASGTDGNLFFKTKAGVLHQLTPVSTGGGAQTSGVEVLDQDSSIGLFDRINFSGTGVTAVKDGDVADVVINGGGGSSELPSDPATDIADISSVARWFKFSVPYTDVQAAATAVEITLASLPIKAWIHAVAWNVSDGFTTGWSAGNGGELEVLLGDEDDSDRWLVATELLVVSRGGYLSVFPEDYIGLTPWMPDSDNTHDLLATFQMNPTGGVGEDLDDLTGGQIDFFFLLSSMNGGVA